MKMGQLFFVCLRRMRWRVVGGVCNRCKDINGVAMACCAPRARRRRLASRSYANEYYTIESLSHASALSRIASSSSVSVVIAGPHESASVKFRFKESSKTSLDLQREWRVAEP